MDERETIQDIRERLVKIELLLENIPKSINLQLDNFEDKLKVANHRIEDLENTINWLSKTAIGALITGAIGILFSLSKLIK